MQQDDESLERVIGRKMYLLPSAGKVGLGHSHTSLSQSEKSCFGANSFDVRSAEVIFRHNEFFKVDVFTE